MYDINIVFATSYYLFNLNKIRGETIFYKRRLQMQYMYVNKNILHLIQLQLKQPM